jgi:hypothetical protein
VGDEDEVGVSPTMRKLSNSLSAVAAILYVFQNEQHRRGKMGNV